MTDRRKQFFQSWEAHGPRDAARKAQQQPPEEVGVIRSIPYRQTSDGKAENESHLVDIFFPESFEGTLPVILDVHGGGWVYGTKELNEYYCMELAKMGFVVFDINYRLIPETDLKGQVQDVAAALYWICEHAHQYHANPKKVFVTGDSAGGQLALLTCAALAKEEYRKVYELPKGNGSVAALGLVCPVPCLHEMSRSEDVMQREWMQVVYGAEEAQGMEKKELWKYSDAEDYLRDCRLPPIYLFTTQGDTRYHWQSQRLQKLLKRYEIPHVYREWKNTGEETLGHVFNVLNPQWKDSREANREMINFFLNFLADSAKEEIGDERF